MDLVSYSPQGLKEWDTTERRTLLYFCFFLVLLLSDEGHLFLLSFVHSLTEPASTLRLSLQDLIKGKRCSQA